MMTYEEAAALPYDPANPPILPSRLLMQPPDDVWGNYDTTEESWLATWHWPSGTKLLQSGAAFYILPYVTDEAVVMLGKLGISAADAPLALFSGLVAEQLEGHRDNEDVLKAGWEKMKKLYSDASTGDLGTFAADAWNLANTGPGADAGHGEQYGVPIMKLDKRTLTLHPSPELFPAALAIVRDAYINGTSIANALATIRDTMAPNSTRIRNLVHVHEANEAIAAHGLAPNSVTLQQYAAKQSMTVDDARRHLLREAGADANGINMNINPNLGSFLINTVLQPSGPKGAWGASKPKPKLSLLQSMTPGLFASGALPTLGGAKKASGTYAPVDAPQGDKPAEKSSTWHPFILAGVGAGSGALVISSHRIVGAAAGAVGGVLASLVIAAHLNSLNYTAPPKPPDPTTTTKA